MSYQTEGFEPDSELSEFLTKIWELDDNKCNPGEHFQIDLQGYVGYKGGDWARDKLFEWVDEDTIFSRRTYKAFRALLDNYEMEAGQAETYTFEEKQETVEFIDAIMETDVMKETHKFLASKKLAPEEVGNFKWKLLNLWFKLVRRTKNDRDLDSSSFEHVFVGETRQEGMIGLHNWIQYYLQEKAGNINYQGYRRRATNLDDEVDRLICTKFLWRERQEKPSCSMFLGSSPDDWHSLYCTSSHGRLSAIPLPEDHQVNLISGRLLQIKS
ncbi:ENDOU [Acanthosepion pharaonis]|uniref:Uridylate-specific endoribonuclease n=1 Tax=Acanthosepion pharaonis TaxID=158019 RepID=A0A812ES70_ACAPH|nr:ENDOU [Sepia pharaonis]